MHIKMILIFIMMILIACSPFEQINQKSNKKEKRKLLISKNKSILFYNVENLFDIYDDPKTQDNEFTPKGYKKWTLNRYKKKIHNLAKVIHSSGSKAPIILGLCEIENYQVIKDLINNQLLNENKYKIIHEHSPDKRGIDVALVYNEDYFDYIEHKTYKIDFPWDASIKSRDILMVKGSFANKDTVYIFVNHWPSRRNGKKNSEPKRMQAAKTLKKAIGKIMKKNQNAKILCMGDFNDYPSDNSITKGINAYGINKHKKGLINLMTTLENQGLGSHYYKGKWGMLDQILVSYSFLQGKKGLGIKNKEAKILKEDWMLYKGKSPSKTYGGANYYGGYSDHLPVYVILK